MRWVRLNIDFDDSPWLFVLSAESQLAWIKLICHMKRDGLGGTCKALAPLVAAKKWGVGDESVVKMLQAAVTDGALVIEGKEWTLTGWDEYQGSDNTRLDRQRRFRERKRAESNDCNAVTPVTDRYGNVLPVRATETETETETSKEKITKKENSNRDRNSSKELVSQANAPNLEEISAYFQSRNVPPEVATVQAERFRDYYDSKGWLVGRAPMRSWQAACRTWIGNMGQFGNARGAPPPPKHERTGIDLMRERERLNQEAYGG